MAKCTMERVCNYKKRLKDDPVKYKAYKLKDKKRNQWARKKVAKKMCIQQRSNCIPAETAQTVEDFFALIQSCGMHQENRTL